MTLSLILSTVKVPLGTPDDSAVGIYEMLDVEEELIQLPETSKLADSNELVPPTLALKSFDTDSTNKKPVLVPPPLWMGKIPSALESATIKPVSQIALQSNSSNIIVAEPMMRDLQKDLVTMIPSSVRRKVQTLEHAPKKQKVTKEDEYQNFMSQFE